MTTLGKLQALDQALDALLPPQRSVEQNLDQFLATLFPGKTITARSLRFGEHRLLDLIGFHLFDGGKFRPPTGSQVRHENYPNLRLPTDFNTRIGQFCSTIRQQLHANLAAYWLERDSRGLSRLVRLASLRRDLLSHEIRLRLGDQTLTQPHATLLENCVVFPQPWQRRHLPTMARPQVYRPLLSGTGPNWRFHLPGVLVVTEHGPEGRLLSADETVGCTLLFSVAHGIEAFDSLAALHQELCERLEDPRQSAPLVELLVTPQEQQRARRAERLRYDWYTDDICDAHAMAIRDALGKRLAQAWQTAWHQGRQRSIEQLDADLNKAMDLRAFVGSQGPVATRYGLLLEKHLPNWLRTTPLQGVAHIMQAMQEQVAAIEAAAAPGLLTLEQFNQHHSLLGWVRQRLREYLLRDPGIDHAPEDIYISVTEARQVGSLVNPLPFGSSSYTPVVSRQQTGPTIETVRYTYRLDELALLNVGWFDLDYWLTARVHLHVDQDLEALTPSRVKQIVRRLNAGSSYQAFLRTHLLDSPQGEWRQRAHGQLNRTRMNADAVKARYAGHFLEDSLEQGYGWASTVIKAPDSNNRPHYKGQQVIARQLLIKGHTVEGVLLLVSPEESKRIVAYCPDIPDRRYWREYTNTRDLVRAVRTDAGLRGYIRQRMPLADSNKLDRLLLKGRLGPHVQLQTITGNLYDALYRAEVRSLLAHTDSVTRSNSELLGEYSINVLRLLLDVITLVLPQRAAVALAFGRMGISIWDGFEAFDQNDHSGALHHAVAALSHSTSALNTMTGSSLMRRVLRGLPSPPPIGMPLHYEVAPETAKLRYKINAPHGEAVYELITATTGLPQYFVKDNHGRYFNVSFDGQHWRATDPSMPDAYLKLPIKRRLDGSWVIDSPVLWHDGLPDLTRLLDACQLATPLAGRAVDDDAQLLEHDTALYLQVGARQLPVRRHLLAGHYHLLLPEGLLGAVPVWAVLRRQAQQWHIRVRQTGRSSEWLPLP